MHLARADSERGPGSFAVFDFRIWRMSRQGFDVLRKTARPADCSKCGKLPACREVKSFTRELISMLHVCYCGMGGGFTFDRPFNLWMRKLGAPT
jgi:hypothetical protein